MRRGYVHDVLVQDDNVVSRLVRYQDGSKGSPSTSESASAETSPQPCLN